jgi:multiple sugar transport system ATP-binding protein
VSKAFGATPVLADVDLAIDDGELVVLVGPSGCGKSTLLRLIAGLEELTHGEILIGGRRVDQLPPQERGVAMMFQSYALYPHMTAYENMAFGLTLRKHPKTEIEERVREAARILGVTDEQLRRKPGALSGGQRQRVAVGRAIVRRPKAFLFDEPLSNLDAKMRVEMRTEISRLHNRLQSTMIYVTHDQAEAMTMGDRIVVMKDGVIQQVDDPLTLYDNPRNMFVAGFIGSPPTNFFSGMIERRDGGLWFVEDGKNGSRGFSFRIDNSTTPRLDARAGQAVVFGCRPEDVSPSPEQPAAKATVEVVEPMGAETHIYLATGHHRFIARLHSRARFTVGEEIGVSFDMRKCHFFDPATERVIG